MEQGWIKLHRQTLENIFLMKDDNAFMVFTKLLMLVNRKTGQIAMGRNQLGDILNMNPRTLYGVLVRLEKQEMLNITSNNRYSIITVVNWQSYQDSSTDDATTRQQRGNNHATTRQHSNKKEEVRIKNKVANATMPSSKNSTAGLTLKQFFFELAKLLGHSDHIHPLPDRLSKLKTRLATFTPEQMRQAAKALSADGRMQGDNEEGKKWGTIDYLIRNNTNVAKYLEEGSNYASPTDLAEELNSGKYI